MTAVLKHELRIYFRSMTAYVFGAFLLLITGIGAMLYNIQAAVSNFEYVLQFGSIIFVVIVPVLTMRVIAEERRQKTDQLLYSLPITTTEIILGKYIALLTVFALPLLVIAFYPLIFSRFGEVFLPTAYGSLFAFFMMGAALIAIGVFISSLTDNQGFAAGIGIAVILFNYFSVSLSEYVSSTPISALAALVIVIILLSYLVRALTGNENIAALFAAVMFLSVMVMFLIDKTGLEGLLPDIMQRLSLFRQFDTFVSGIFDITALVFFISVIIFFLFLSVQSLEKRRYN